MRACLCACVLRGCCVHVDFIACAQRYCMRISTTKSVVHSLSRVVFHWSTLQTWNVLSTHTIMSLAGPGCCEGGRSGCWHCAADRGGRKGIQNCHPGVQGSRQVRHWRAPIPKWILQEEPTQDGEGACAELCDHFNTCAGLVRVCVCCVCVCCVCVHGDVCQWCCSVV